jgi:hypothetical protein
LPFPLDIQASKLARISNEDRREILQAIRSLVRDAAPGYSLQADQVFKRISMDAWSVEWNLPRWLGERVSLSPGCIRKLVLANVLGLAYVRLRDDRIDGENHEIPDEASIHLESLFLSRALETLQFEVGENPVFTARLNHYLAAWKASASTPAFFPAFDLRALTHLVGEGAPLLIVSEAVHALAGMHVDRESLSAPVQNYLIAAVLYDHLKDWRADIMVGRKNYFISAMLGSDAVEELNLNVEHAVFSVMLHGVKLEKYCYLINQALAQGVESARACGLVQFAQHLAALGDEARSGGEQLLRGMETMLDRATALVEFG